MLALITSEELEDLNQIMVKQLKNRYNDLNFHRKFVIGIDKSRMRLYNVEQSAQDNVSDSAVFDKGAFTETENGTSAKFNKDRFKDFL